MSATPGSRLVRVATWNMDHWKRTAQTRRHAWSFLANELGTDVALLQECVPPDDMPRSQIVYREIAGNRPWGTAVVALDDECSLEESGAVRTRYGSARFSMLGTHPGTIIVARVAVPDVGLITCVSAYGLIEVYAQTTLFRIVADLIPLFHSRDGERVVLGGDFNITTSLPSSASELKRYDAIMGAFESLGLRNVAETATERPLQFEGCRCGESPCHHVRTYGDDPGSQLDWLFATPELARRCRVLRVEQRSMGLLSDHAPLIAEFDVLVGIPTCEWDPESFVKEVGIRVGPRAERVADEIIAWAERKHQGLKRRGHAHASLDRLPVSSGPDPELWVQLDLRRPEALGYTISMKADGRIVVQFQNMRRPPFDTEEGRRSLWMRFTELPGVEVQERLNGRPSFPMQALDDGDNLERFLEILDDAVDEIVRYHEASE